MIYLIFYDISEDKIRAKIAQGLIAASYERIQLSVFCGRQNPKANRLLWQQLNSLLSKAIQAKFYILKISQKHFKNIEIIGESALDIDYLIGAKNSLFI